MARYPFAYRRLQPFSIVRHQSLGVEAMSVVEGQGRLQSVFVHCGIIAISNAAYPLIERFPWPSREAQLLKVFDDSVEGRIAARSAGCRLAMTFL